MLISAGAADFDHAGPAWNALAQGNPFVEHDFLRLLESTGCAAPRTGWHAQHLLLQGADGLQAAAPVYLKTHSRGEFVFDHGWAQAYAQHGLRYYPKLLVAAPFSPVAGPRLLAQDDASRAALAQALIELTQQSGASSAHVLFAGDDDITALRNAGFMVREGVQFHWRNAGYGCWADFTATMSQPKRKKLMQDRKRVAAAGVQFQWLTCDALQPHHLAFFYRCYANTYAAHGSQPYLSFEFFEQWHAQNPERLMLVWAELAGEPIACALNVHGPGRLYGRYWGATQFVSGLHFEACYAQSIEYCIAQGIEVFEGGAQGEHKMARGLLPVRTYSAHWVADRRFAAAIESFLDQERQAVAGYVDELQQSSPFKSPVLPSDFDEA